MKLTSLGLHLLIGSLLFLAPRGTAADLIIDDFVTGCQFSHGDGTGTNCLQDADDGDVFLFLNDEARPWRSSPPFANPRGIKYVTDGRGIMLDDTNDNNQVRALLELQRGFTVTDNAFLSKMRMVSAIMDFKVRGLSDGATGTLNVSVTASNGRSEAVFNFSEDFTAADDTINMNSRGWVGSRHRFLPVGPGAMTMTMTIDAIVDNNTNPNFRLQMLAPRGANGVRVGMLVPEPSTAPLLLLGCIGWICRHRRQRHSASTTSRLTSL